MATMKTTADYYKDTEYFSQHNNNPSYEDGKKWNKSDCVIRAFAEAAGISWIEAYDLLSERARTTYDVPNSNSNYPHVLVEYGFVKNSVKVVKGKKRMTLEDFCKSHKKGRYCVRVANHLTAVVDGVCYDEWNPANICVYVYYELTKK